MPKSKTYSQRSLLPNSSYKFLAQIVYVGIERMNSKTKRIESYSNFILHYQKSGSITLKMNGKSFRIHQGQIFMTPQNVSFSKIAHADDIEFYYIALTGNGTEELLRNSGFTADHPVISLSPANQKQAEVAFHKVYEGLKDNNFRGLSSSYLALATFLDSLVALNPDAYHSFERSPNECAKKAKHYIEENYVRQITVDTISHALGLSHSYLSKLFKQNYGMTVKNYITSYRIEKAKSCLQQSDKPILEIASQVGFNDDVTFFRSFKAKVGCSPRKYRQEFANQSSSI